MSFSIVDCSVMGMFSSHKTSLRRVHLNGNAIFISVSNVEKTLRPIQRQTGPSVEHSKRVK